MIFIQRNRISDWQAKLVAKIDAPVELIYGQSDCFLYSCEIVRDAVAGIDYADELRGTYSGEEEADALMVKWGGISTYLTHRIGHLPLEHVMQAQMGDLVTLSDGQIEVLGVCMGWRVAFLNHPPRTGLRSVRLELCHKAWST